jgi:hypothetical protein
MLAIRVYKRLLFLRYEEEDRKLAAKQQKVWYVDVHEASTCHGV